MGRAPSSQSQSTRSGVDWMVLSAWRFLFAAVVSWAWLLLWSSHRQALRSLSTTARDRAHRVGHLLHRQQRDVFRRPWRRCRVARRTHRLHLPGDRCRITIRYGRRLQGRRAWGALALAIAGVALAVGGIDPSAAPPPIGLVLIIASPIIYAVWIVLAARFGGERGSRTSWTCRLTKPRLRRHATSGGGANRRDHDHRHCRGVVAHSHLRTSRPVLPSQIPTEAWIPLHRRRHRLDRARAADVLRRRTADRRGPCVARRALSSPSTPSCLPRSFSGSGSARSNSSAARWSSWALSLPRPAARRPRQRPVATSSRSE